MTERQLVAQFAKELRVRPDIYFNVMNDTFGGHEKPFDAFACHKGKFFAFEFKKGHGKIQGHQISALQKVYDAGGRAYVVRLFDTKEAAFYFVGAGFVTDSPCIVFNFKMAATCIDQVLR